jgi:hypothetical protein
MPTTIMPKNPEPIIDPLVCPLCGERNDCLNLGEADRAKACWCNDPTLTFPAELLAQVPQTHQRKACICRACAIKFAKEQSEASQQ